MVSINFTLFVEFTLFVLFLAMAHQAVWRPLLRTMDARESRIATDKAEAEAGRKEAHRVEAMYVEQLTGAHQQAAQRLHKARYDAYQDGRARLDELKSTADRDVETFRDGVAEQVEEERRKIAVLLPELVEEADRKISAEGSLL